MTNKEIGEIRRHTRRDRSNMTALYGCFVNSNKEIISQFRQSLGTMPENEADQFFSYFKRSLSGTPGKNLIDLAFSVAQIADGPEHKLLMALRETSLNDEESLKKFYDQVVHAVTMDTSYLILIGCDTYDTPFKRHDAMGDLGDSEEAYRYLMCCVCPVKTSKPAIEYKAPSKEFHNSEIMQLLTNPAFGFLYPAFDDRTTNLYNALFYTKDAGARHEEFLSAVFNAVPFILATEQKQSFDTLLSETLGDQCNMDVVQAVHQEISARIQLHKECKTDSPLVIGKADFETLLSASGVSEDKVSSFSQGFDKEFGADAEIPPRNIINPKVFEVSTPDVMIRVRPERSDLIETRIIGGKRYIMICTDEEDVEVNGVKVFITENE